MGAAVVLFVVAAAGPVAAETPAPRELTLDADELDLDVTDGTVTARGVRLSACGSCGRPWTLGARRATLQADGDVELLLPVLRVGPVPVFALPWLLVRTGRRPGLLLPRLSLSSGGGVELGQGLWTPLGPTAELAVVASWLSAIGGARLGASFHSDQARLEATVHAGTELVSARLRGRGWQRASSLDAAAVLDWTFDPAAARRLSATPLDEARPYERSRLALVHAGQGLQVSLDSELIQGLAAEASAGSPIPMTGLAVSLHPVGVGPLWASARLSHRLQWLPGGSWPAWRAAAAPRLRALFRVGPVLAEVSAASLHAVYEPATAESLEPAARNVAVAGLELSSPLTRRFGRSLRHDVVPRVVYRLALVDASTRDAGSPGVDQALWPVAGHLIGVLLESSLRGASGRRVELRVAQLFDLPRLAGEGAGHRLDARLLLADPLASIAFDASVAEWPEAALSEGGATGTIGGRRASLSLGWRWLGPGRGSSSGPDLRSDLPWIVPFLPDRAHAGSAQLAVSPHRELAIAGGAWVDLGAGELLVAGGRMAYENRCGCLAAALEVWHRRGRRWPDVLILVDVGGLRAR